MKHPLQYLWRHPRRTGFGIFNLLALVLIVAWIVFGPHNNGIFDLPNLALSYTALSFVVLLMVWEWVAWLVMLIRRHWPARRTDTSA